MFGLRKLALQGRHTAASSGEGPCEVLLPIVHPINIELAEQLTTILDRGDVSPAEQYRFIIEAFQREMEYGRTIDTYTDDVTIGDAVKTVDVFRYGRIALVYVTQDRSEVGRWNRETKAWEVLDGKYKDDIVRGIRIASKVATPAVIMGPVSKLSAQQ